MNLRPVLAMAVAAVLTAALACGSGAPPAPEPTGQGSVHGLILEVVARSLLELDSLTIVDGDGVKWEFVAGDAGSAEFTPSHLREHMLSGAPVTVTFHRQGATMVIDRLSD